MKKTKKQTNKNKQKQTHTHTQTQKNKNKNKKTKTKNKNKNKNTTPSTLYQIYISFCKMFRCRYLGCKRYTVIQFDRYNTLLYSLYQSQLYINLISCWPVKSLRVIDRVIFVMLYLKRFYKSWNKIEGVYITTIYEHFNMTIWVSQFELILYKDKIGKLAKQIWKVKVDQVLSELETIFGTLVLNSSFLLK